MGSTEVWKEWDNGLDQVIMQYVEELFTASSTKNSGMLNVIQPRVSSEHKKNLVNHFLGRKLRKSPKLDAMNSTFFQHFLPIVGENVISICLYCLNTFSFKPNLNDTTTVLTSKKDCLERVIDLRPIALFNFFL